MDDYLLQIICTSCSAVAPSARLLVMAVSPHASRSLCFSPSPARHFFLFFSFGVKVSYCMLVLRFTVGKATLFIFWFRYLGRLWDFGVISRWLRA